MYREFPCALCGADCPSLLCPGCNGDLPRLTTACTRCGLPSQGSVCAACVVKPLRWENMVVPFSFAYPIDKIIHEFKYLGAVFWGSFLAREVARRSLFLNVPRPEALIPVPVHPRRLAERGFNQAVELARGIGSELDIPVLSGALARVGSRAPQVGLSASERRKNVRGAFATVGGTLAARRVAIVDDILTTGATGNELARILLRRGVHHVQIWVVARTPISQRLR